MPELIEQAKQKLKDLIDILPPKAIANLANFLNNLVKEYGKQRK